MASDLEALPLEKPRTLHLDWAWPMLTHPRQTMARATETARGTWITPLLILSVLAVVTVLISGPLRAAAAASGTPTLPPDYQYWSPEQQQQYMQSLAVTGTTVFTHILPLAGDLVRIWASWLILSAVLHLTLTLGGSRSSMTTTLNLVAWASLPAALRYIVQIVAILSTHQLITSPGLTGFAPPEAKGILQYIASALPFIDLYLLWMAALLVAGVRMKDGVSLGKALFAVILSLVFVLALLALPKFLASSLGSLSTVRPFFF